MIAFEIETALLARMPVEQPVAALVTWLTLVFGPEEAEFLCTHFSEFERRCN